MKKLLIALTTATLATSGFTATFKIVAIPDTQRMAQYYPAKMKGQTEWITNNVATENIAFVTQLGDIVDEGYDLAQWNNATAALDLLDGVVPYSVCIGNHDYDSSSNRVEGVSEYISRFGSSRYSGYSWYKGSHRDLDHYQIFSADGRDWLHINLEFAPDSESLLWAQRVIDENPTLPVILSTHNFLNASTNAPSGILSAAPPSSQWGTVANGGENQWYQFVKQNDQIFMVLSGHYFNGLGGARTNLVNSYGRDVFVMCVNYQDFSDDDAHFRILEFDSANNQINATSYDPNTGNYLADSVNQFTLSMDFSARLTNFNARETFSTIQAANITVVENNLLNSNNSVKVTIPAGQSTADISVVPVGTTDYTDHSNGDYYIQAGSRIEDDLLGGIMLASVAENGRTSMDGTNYYHIAQAPAGGHGQYKVSTATTANTDEYPGDGGLERDVNVAVAYFPFDQGWTCGRVETYQNAATNWDMVASENVKLGVNLTQIPQGDVDTNLLHKATYAAPRWGNPDSDRGIWKLSLPGVDSINDGILLVCGGKNEDNYAAASPFEDGSGWQISVQDSAGTWGTESDPWNFVYVPYNTENVVAGRVGVKNGVVSGTGGFTAVSNAPGTVRLDITGYTPSDGTLIVSTENDWYNSDDFTTYEPDGTGWLIQTRDLPGATPTSSSTPQFTFLFIPFASAPSEPGVDYVATWNTANGDWMTESNWDGTQAMNLWGIPGWVSGNPLNTGAGWENLSEAFIQSGVVNVTPTSSPDGLVAALNVGSNTGDSILNIGSDFTVKGKTRLGYESSAAEVATINQTAGNVSYGSDTNSRSYFGRGDGQSVYNFSGGTIATPGDWDFFGNEVDNTFDTGSFTLNQTAGAFTDTGAGHLVMGDERGTYAEANISGGTFKANAAGFRIASKGVATVTVNGSSRLESSATDFGVGYYTDSGIAATGTLNVAGSGSVTHSGARFMVGRSGHGVLNIGDSATVSLSGKDVWVGRYGTADGEINQSGGTFTASGSGILEVGDSADTTARVTVSGGTFNANSAASTRIGNYGTGSVVIEGTGKLNSSSTFLSVGSHGDAHGTLTVRGNGSVDTTGEFGVGMWRETSGVNGVGVLNISENGAVTNNSPNHFSIGRSGTGTLNLDGNGKLIVTTASDFNIAAWGNGSQGTVNMSGGLLRHLSNKTFYVGRTGNGTFIQTGGEVDVPRFQLAKETGSVGFYSISGGNLAIRNYIGGGVGGSGTFEVNGSAATGITAHRAYFWEDHFRVKLDANGSTPIEVTAGNGYDGKIDLRRALFEVDTLPSFSGQVGDTYDIMRSDVEILIDEAGYPERDMIFSNLSATAEFSYSVVSSGGWEILRLTVLSATSKFERWTGDYGLSGADAAPDFDYDGDGLDNLYEYGLGGDPTNPADRGLSPTYEQDATSLTYVYPKLSDSNSGLDYYLELTDDLIYTPWTNSGYTVTGTGIIDSEFDAVTNRIPADVKDEQFVRLIIEEQ